MKALIIGEYRQGKLLEATYENVTFAEMLGAESAMFLVGNEAALPNYGGKLYLADVDRCGEFNPEGHKQLILDVVAQENPDLVLFSHSSYGWDLAPRVALALKAAQISEVVGFDNGAFVVPVCNAKLRRNLRATSAIKVVTLQAGAFPPSVPPTGTPTIVQLGAAVTGRVAFIGHEVAEQAGVDLTKAEIIVGAGRGIGKSEYVGLISRLAQALGGEFAASRPVVDAGWVEQNRQVGSTGQSVAPKLYLACGISGAIQHLAGMKKSNFVVAVNTDKDAPIGEIADVLVVADLKEFVPILTEKLQAL